MHFGLNLRPDARAIRQRLFYPPNAVPDRGIDLKRVREPVQTPKPEPLPEWLPAMLCLWHMLWAMRLPATNSAPQPRIDTILQAVAEHYEVHRKDILSARRSRDVVLPRQVAMYLAKTITKRSLPEIGRHFGGRDHTTVLHAVKKIDALMKIDGDLAADIAKLRASLS